MGVAPTNNLFTVNAYPEVVVQKSGMQQNQNSDQLFAISYRGLLMRELSFFYSDIVVVKASQDYSYMRQVSNTVNGPCE